MDERTALEALADDLGVLRRYVDGLGRTVTVGPETLVAVCAALGAPLDAPTDAPEALRALRASAPRSRRVQPVVVAWDGVLRPIRVPAAGPVRARLDFEGGGYRMLPSVAGTVQGPGARLPAGYHRLRIEADGTETVTTVISTPTRSWRRPGRRRSWGIGTQVAALRSRRSGPVGDLDDLERVCRWIGARGGDLVTALPLLPTFNTAPTEPSPYSPVSRLFWSELLLDPGPDADRGRSVDRLDVERADAAVREALAGHLDPRPEAADPELDAYARFRGAQRRLGRNWRDWPAPARQGRLTAAEVDPDEERFHRVAQLRLRRRLSGLGTTMDRAGVRLGIDLAVGVHPDGYDPWSRPELFAAGMSVGAPPDPGFPSGQDWGFAPVLPHASRAEGHAYLARSVAHQASLAGVLRIDHVMALSRLYWIPHGFGLHEGTYVRYPTDELFAVVCLESHRHRCEIIGENLGTVPAIIDEALPRHDIRGMVLAIFEADADEPRSPARTDVAMVGTHDTPTFVGWLEGRDIDERVASGLLDADAAPSEHTRRSESAARLADLLGGSVDDPGDLLDRLLRWLGRSESPLVVPWIEDLWLEPDQVNLPGTRSSERPNWQRPMTRWLDDVIGDPEVERRLRILAEARMHTAARADADVDLDSTPDSAPGEDTASPRPG